MRKNLTIILLSCLLFGNPIQDSSDSFQPTDIIETLSNGGEGDVGPPHTPVKK